MMSFVAGVMLLAAAAVPPFPFTHYEDVTGAHPTGMTMCDGTVDVIIAGDWRVFSTQARDIFVHYNLRGEPDFVYFVVDNDKGKRISVRMAMTIAEARVRYPDACAYFLEKDV